MTDHTITLLHTEHNFVLMHNKNKKNHLNVHTIRDRDNNNPHTRFSHSITEQMVQTNEPFVTMNANNDNRITNYISIHQLMLHSITCTPIETPHTKQKPTSKSQCHTPTQNTQISRQLIQKPKETLPQTIIK